nr:hypothetical protein Iba_chr06dCG7860 [Ipomoea batatas]
MGCPTVVNHLDLLCLYYMVKGVKIHMEIVMARMLQAHASFKTSTIFIGPFLSCLLRGLGLGPQLDAEWVLATIESHDTTIEEFRARLDDVDSINVHEFWAELT